MDEAEPLKQLGGRNLPWMEVAAIREAWIAEKVFCVAPKVARGPLRLLAAAVQDARTLDEAREFGKKIEAILEWMWPANTPMRMDVFQHDDAFVEVPAVHKPRSQG